MGFFATFVIGLSMASVLYYATAVFTVVMASVPSPARSTIVKLQDISYYIPPEAYVRTFLHLLNTP
jgi:hypothetical protein